MNDPGDRPTIWPLYIATFVSTYTVAVASVSAPGMQAALGTTAAQASLAVGAYSATVAAGLIICGRLGDRWGRRRLFRIGTLGLIITALLTASAPNIGLLVVARLLQGCAAAITTPQVLSTIQAVLTGPDRLRSVSLYAVCAGSGTVGGQVIGGLVMSAVGPDLGWRGAYASVGVLAFVARLGSRYLTESKSPAPLGIDVRGSIVLAASLFLLIAGLTNVAAVEVAAPLRTPVALATTVTLLVLAVIGLLLMIPHSRSREASGRPSILPARVVGVPGVRIGIALAVLLFMMIGGFMYNFAVLSQKGFGLSPAESGLSMMVIAASFIVTSSLGSRILTRLGGAAAGGPRLLLFAAGVQGAGLAILGIFALAGLDPFIAWFQLAALLIGGGQGLMMGPLVSVVMAAIPDSVAGLTGGLVATGQQTGIGLGVAVLSSTFAGLGQLMPMQTAYGWTLLGTLVLTGIFAWLTWRLGVLGRRGPAAGQPGQAG